MALTDDDKQWITAQFTAQFERIETRLMIWFQQWQLEPLTTWERAARIGELEARYGLSSADVIKAAESGTLPPGPHFVEWLILLDRGDLVRKG